MTYTTPTLYWEVFQELGRDKLRLAGITCQLISANDALMVEIIKSGEHYLLFFSTHPLDFYDGVMVCQSADRKIHYDQRVLPTQRTHNPYGHSTAEIERLIVDLVEKI